jgi:hypothetical protein
MDGLNANAQARVERKGHVAVPIGSAAMLQPAARHAKLAATAKAKERPCPT